MKIRVLQNRLRPSQAAFSIVEVMVAMAIVGILFLALYAGFLSGFQVIHLARENLRATQIMVEKMETIRLYTWEQVTNTAFIPPAFTSTYYPTEKENNLTYSGKVTVAPVPADTSGFSPSYNANMRMVTVELVWTNSGVQRKR